MNPKRGSRLSKRRGKKAEMAGITWDEGGERAEGRHKRFRKKKRLRGGN